MKREDRIAIIGRITELLENGREQEAFIFLTTEKQLASSTAYGYMTIAKAQIGRKQ